MRIKLVVGVLAVVAAGLLVNAVAVDRDSHVAEPFGGGRVLPLDGPDLNVREYGRADGDKAIVLLHGYSASVQWWDQVAPALAADGHRVVAIDLVGHGGSEAPRDEDAYGAAGQSGAVREALHVLGIRQAVLVGHSMGGAVAVAVAEDEPELVKRIVVSDTPAGVDQGALPLLKEMVCWPVVGPALDRFRAIDAFDTSSLQTGFADDYPVPDFAYRSLQRQTHTGVCDSNVVRDLDGQQDIADRLAALDPPALVIWGERDVLTPTAANVERYTAVGLAPVLIDGSGHTPMVEKPDEFLAAISDFVRD